jgi:hypothetical protein
MSVTAIKLYLLWAQSVVKMSTHQYATALHQACHLMDETDQAFSKLSLKTSKLSLIPLKHHLT